jgi:hypothetical protein
MKKLTVTVLLFATTVLQVSAQDLESLNFAGSLSGSGGSGTSDQFAYDCGIDGSGRRVTCGEFGGDMPTNFGNTSGGITTSLLTAGQRDGYVCMYDAADALQWTVTIGGVSSDVARTVCFAPDLNHKTNIYVAGTFMDAATIRLNNSSGSFTLGAVTTGSLPLNNRTFFIMKLTDQGLLQWVYVSSGPANYREEAADITARSNVNGTTQVFVCGRYQQQTTFASASGSFVTPNSGVTGKWDGFVLAYQDMGLSANLLWGNTVSGSGALLDENHDRCLGIACGERYVYVTGAMTLNSFFSSFGYPAGALTLNPTGTDDAFVSQYNWNGSLAGVQRMGGSGVTDDVLSFPQDEGRSITVDRNERVYVAGRYAATQIAGQGGTFGGITMPGMAGGALSPNNDIYEDIFVVCMNGNVAPATVLWANRYASTNSDGPDKINVDNCGVRLYLSGTYENAFTLGISSGVPIPFTSPNRNSFFAELNPANGAAAAATTCRFWGANWQRVFAIEVNAVGDVSACGSFNQSGPMNAQRGGGPILQLTGTGQEDVFLARWDNISYPITSPTALAYHGIGVLDCDVIATGDFSGTVNYPGFPALTAVGGGAAHDAFFVRTTLYGTATAFGRITNDAANSTVTDATVGPLNNVIVGGNSSIGNISNFPLMIYSVPSTPSAVAWINNRSALWVAFAYSNPTYGGSATCNAVDTDLNGDVYMAGSYTGALTFKDRFGTVTTPPLLPISHFDYYLAKFSANGALLWYTTGGGPGNDAILGLDVTGQDILVSGHFGNGCTFNGAGGTSVSGVASSGGLDAFVLHYKDMNYPLGTTQPNIVSYKFYGTTNDDRFEDVSSPEGDYANVIAVGFSAPTGRIRSYNMLAGPAAQNFAVDLPFSLPASVGVADNRIQVGTGFNLGNILYTYDLTGNQLCARALPNPSDDMFILQGNTHGDDGENVFTCGMNIITRASSIGCGLSSRIMNPEPEEVNSDDAPAVALFPNPSNGNLTLRISGSIEVPSQLQIIDLVGRIVFEQANITSGETPIDCSELANGVYIYNVITGDETQSGKLVIKK